MDDVRRAAYANWAWGGLQLFLGIAMVTALPVPVIYVAPLFLEVVLLALAGLLTFRRVSAGPMLAMVLYALIAVVGAVVSVQRGQVGGVFMALALAALLGRFNYKALAEIRGIR